MKMVQMFGIVRVVSSKMNELGIVVFQRDWIDHMVTHGSQREVKLINLNSVNMMMVGVGMVAIVVGVVGLNKVRRGRFEMMWRVEMRPVDPNQYHKVVAVGVVSMMMGPGLLQGLLDGEMMVIVEEMMIAVCMMMMGEGLGDFGIVDFVLGIVKDRFDYNSYIVAAAVAGVGS
jgi:hypothetical protein